ncbi:siderophore synthetase [Brachybacterium endophyticum]|uniref:Lysine N-acyltransferase MbtK n=1 Tax=Brachybacterium endophyticum TaxID=2182385 RepID=A0A2U2RHX6_9MICO|nr:GNAT family N-acetyltransferase [Brachybacterium endophyticum]PWH05431.1 siderophore synthetase [Brachybacterium endophyticum]
MQIDFRPLDPDRDASRLHAWLTDPRARFWEMTDHSPQQVSDYLREIDADPAQAGWLGTIADGGGEEVVYVETYDPTILIPAKELTPRAGDLGMHLLTGPPAGEPQRGFTRQVMGEVMRFCFEQRGAERVVVEPDHRNTAILAKNAAAGFRLLREIDLTADGHTKRAALSICTREDFAASPLGGGAPDPHAHLRPDVADAVHRHLLAKAVAEFSHERILEPAELGDDWWELTVPRSEDATSDEAAHVRYRFRARVLPLEHWLIEEDSLVRLETGGESSPGVAPMHAPIDVLEFVVAFQDVLGIPDDLVSTYLEELASTFAAACAKLHDAREGHRPSSEDLLGAGLQQIEAAMTEGHPGFLAGSGRIGYSLTDYRDFAPEQGRRTRLQWVAVRRELSHLSLGEGYGAADHLAGALSPEEREGFDSRIADRGLDPADYHLMPMHPWQVDHRLSLTFAADVARQDLVPLGAGGDEFQPQQSLRTFFDLTRPGAPYVKVALAIQNMGFLRGLSPHYMRDTPAINDWVHGLVQGDPEFADLGFSVLRERSALGYTGDVYHRTRTTNPHRKMLAALWRENPLPLLGEGERAMTMAALLHRDHEGVAFVSRMIRASGIAPSTWVEDYLGAYLQPLVHALLAHDVVFMPHGENLILRVKDQRVVGAFMKDIGEETAVLGPRSLSENIERMRARVPGDEKALSIFTDVFDGVLRHLSGILDADGLLDAQSFWRLVARSLDAYESRHPGQARGLAGDVDLRSGAFAHSCLNRLQLRNTLQMVDIGNQAESLLYAGTMPNPVAR